MSTTPREQTEVIGDLHATIVRLKTEVAALTARVEASDELVTDRQFHIGRLIEERDDARAALRELVGVMNAIGRTDFYQGAYERAAANLKGWE